MKTISVQDLRLRMAEILEELKHGVKFLLIYRSKPVGELTPLKRGFHHDLETSPLQIFAAPPQPLKIKAKRSAVSVIRKERA